MAASSLNSDRDPTEHQRRQQLRQHQQEVAPVEEELDGQEDEERVGGKQLYFPTPLLCVARSAGDAAAGALLGSFVGLGSGLLKKKGFRGSFVDVQSCAKTFAVMSGVHSLVGSFLTVLRGKDDAMNAGIAGCCTGFALSFPGTPPALLQSCVTFGAFSCILQVLNKQQVAAAHPLLAVKERSQDVLPPFTLPVPGMLANNFSAFQESLSKQKTSTR